MMIMYINLKLYVNSPALEEGMSCIVSPECNHEISTCHHLCNRDSPVPIKVHGHTSSVSLKANIQLCRVAPGGC